MVDGILVGRVQAIVGPHATVINAVSAFRGPRPGLEALAWVPAFLVVAGLRTYVTTARTDSELLVSTSDSGARVVIGAHTYWVAGRSRDEVARTIAPTT